MTQNQINTTLSKLNLVLEDFQMLRDGLWIPDEVSCESSIENLTDIIYIINNE
jgi:hypothetical protein